MATLNGARALGLADVTGSLLPGKLADLVAVDLADVATQPVFDPVSHLVNAADRACVSDVWVGGVRIVADRRLATIDESAVLARTHAWQRKLATSMTTDDPLPECRSGGARQVLGARPSLVGSRQRVPPAARDQSAAARVDRTRRRRLAGQGDPRRRLRRRHSGRSDGQRRRARDRHRPFREGAGRRAIASSRIRDRRRLPADCGRSARCWRRRRGSISSPAWKCWSTCRTRPPSSTACAALAKPGGTLVFSTLNRNPKSYLFAILGAEYMLRLLPRGTHDWTRFLRPSELAAFARRAGLDLEQMIGMTYNPLTRVYRLEADTSVNYLAAYRKPAHAVTRRAHERADARRGARASRVAADNARTTPIVAAVSPSGRPDMAARPLPVTTVLFDLDGTLADSAGDLALALNRVRGEHGLPPVPAEKLRDYASSGARGLLYAGMGVTPEHGELWRAARRLSRALHVMPCGDHASFRRHRRAAGRHRGARTALGHRDQQARALHDAGRRRAGFGQARRDRRFGRHDAASQAASGAAAACGRSIAHCAGGMRLRR